MESLLVLACHGAPLRLFLSYMIQHDFGTHFMYQLIICKKYGKTFQGKIKQYSRLSKTILYFYLLSGCYYLSVKQIRYFLFFHSFWEKNPLCLVFATFEKTLYFHLLRFTQSGKNYQTMRINWAVSALQVILLKKKVPFKQGNHIQERILTHPQFLHQGCNHFFHITFIETSFIIGIKNSFESVSFEDGLREYLEELVSGLKKRNFIEAIQYENLLFGIEEAHSKKIKITLDKEIFKNHWVGKFTIINDNITELIHKRMKYLIGNIPMHRDLISCNYLLILQQFWLSSDTPQSPLTIHYILGHLLFLIHLEYKLSEGKKYLVSIAQREKQRRFNLIKYGKLGQRTQAHHLSSMPIEAAILLARITRGKFLAPGFSVQHVHIKKHEHEHMLIYPPINGESMRISTSTKTEPHV
ncbi:hypothetical protein VP01_3459g1 [Puccinia sorghi]|uniref:Uncharacterized protein n=1 Tax=Puccinia sorghi TaxID=27349 RepID=A0A0L6UWY8_9BASI|nr:hypothetical protein VP01_3459g1 [Puccinia sorghi]